MPCMGYSFCDSCLIYNTHNTAAIADCSGVGGYLPKKPTARSVFHEAVSWVRSQKP